MRSLNLLKKLVYINMIHMYLVLEFILVVRSENYLGISLVITMKVNKVLTSQLIVEVETASNVNRNMSKVLCNMEIK